MRIHHLALRTRDVPRLEAFYAGVLGLPVLSRPSGDRVWLAADETIVMLEPCSADEPAVPPGSLELLAFAIAPEERGTVVERLGRAGVPLDGETAFTVYARDPDGRRVAMSHYPSPRLSP